MIKRPALYGLNRKSRRNLDQRHDDYKSADLEDSQSR